MHAQPGQPDAHARSQRTFDGSDVGYTHFLLKGLARVRTEWSLITLVYNLKRVLNLVNFRKLMAAVS
jgi:hypothetical protein